MKVGFLQFAPQFGAKDGNLKKIEKLLMGIRADLVVLPELFNTGYTFLDKAEVAALAEPADSGPTATFMLDLARRMDCLIAYGYAERAGDIFYDSMNLVSPDELISTYRKAHLFFEEKSFFKPGDTGFDVHGFRGVKVGMLICFDYIFPEAARTLALKGCQIILHPANLVLSYCPDAMVTRAIENRVFIITADRIGEEKRNGKGNRFIGKSQVVSPRGEILIRIEDEECVEVVDIDPRLALDKKVTPTNDVISDRRPDLYFR